MLASWVTSALMLTEEQQAHKTLPHAHHKHHNVDFFEKGEDNNCSSSMFKSDYLRPSIRYCWSQLLLALCLENYLHTLT